MALNHKPLEPQNIQPLSPKTILEHLNMLRTPRPCKTLQEAETYESNSTELETLGSLSNIQSPTVNPNTKILENLRRPNHCQYYSFQNLQHPLLITNVPCTALPYAPS